jgi:hypothetical protein
MIRRTNPGPRKGWGNSYRFTVLTLPESVCYNSDTEQGQMLWTRFTFKALWASMESADASFGYIW